MQCPSLACSPILNKPSLIQRFNWILNYLTAFVSSFLNFYNIDFWRSFSRRLWQKSVKFAMSAIWEPGWNSFKWLQIHCSFRKQKQGPKIRLEFLRIEHETQTTAYMSLSNKVLLIKNPVSATSASYEVRVCSFICEFCQCGDRFIPNLDLLSSHLFLHLLFLFSPQKAKLRWKKCAKYCAAGLSYCCCCW